MKRTIAFALLITLGLTATGCATSANSSSNKDLNSSQSEASTDVPVPSDPLACVRLKNVGNRILLNQPRFSGDPEPTDTIVNTQYAITNVCGRTIVGLKGTESFQNIVGDEIFSGNFTSDLTIKNGSTVLTNPSLGYSFNEFEDAYGTLSATNENKTRGVVTLSKIVFADGTTVTN